jgi:hypothetical protein
MPGELDAGKAARTQAGGELGQGEMVKCGHVRVGNCS